MAAEVVTTEDFAPVLERLALLEEQQAIADIVLNHIGWIEAGQVMAMEINGLTSWKGLNSAADKGDLMIDKSKKKALVSVKSLMGLLKKKGFTSEYIQKRFTP